MSDIAIRVENHLAGSVDRRVYLTFPPVVAGASQETRDKSQEPSIF